MKNDCHNLFQKVEDLAVEITKQKDKSKAVEELKKLLKSDQFIFNKEKFPENESDDEAHENCDNDEGEHTENKFIPKPDRFGENYQRDYKVRKLDSEFNPSVRPLVVKIANHC